MRVPSTSSRVDSTPFPMEFLVAFTGGHGYYFPTLLRYYRAMQIGVIIGEIISTERHPAFEQRKLLYVQRLDLEGKPWGTPTMAIDYVDAGVGDIVILGAAPGLASTVFGIPKAPIRELIMGVIDHVRVETTGLQFGHSHAWPPSKSLPQKPPSAVKGKKSKAP